MDVQGRLKELTVFRGGVSVFGLPRTLFIGLAGVCGAESLLLSWWLGPLLFAVIFPPLYLAHLTDPAALKVWADAVRERHGAIDPAKTRYFTTTYE